VLLRKGGRIVVLLRKESRGRTCDYCVVQDAGEKLKSSQHERAALQKQRDALARQLAHVAEKISSGMIPDTDELAVPEHIAAAAEASASVVGLCLCPLDALSLDLIMHLWLFTSTSVCIGLPLCVR
jgi:hypothetical protein